MNIFKSISNFLTKTYNGVYGGNIIKIYNQNSVEYYTDLLHGVTRSGRFKNTSPFYIRLTSSPYELNNIMYDTRADPIISIQRDAARVTYKINDTMFGPSFIQNQTMLQKYATFDETSTYNRNSVINATIKNPDDIATTRHVVNNTGTGLNGTATGELPKYVQSHGDGTYGLLRWKTATMARNNFNSIWQKDYDIQEITFETPVQSADWEYRPEYKTTAEDNVNQIMIHDENKLLSYKGKQGLYFDNGIVRGKFYNDDVVDMSSYEDAETGMNQPEEVAVTDIMHNFPKGYDGAQNDDNSYAGTTAMGKRTGDAKDQTSGIAALYDRMFTVLVSDNGKHPMYQKSAEKYESSEHRKIDSSNNYSSIPGPDYASNKVFENRVNNSEITLDKRGFAKAAVYQDGPSGSYPKYSGADTYNMLEPVYGSRKEIPPDLITAEDPNQSQDTIFFYFFDLINETYIPFRAILAGITDQHSPDIEEVKYIGRADRLYLYKGFSRDINFNFKVVANSVEELVPMWERINYLVGLARPSKYTDRAYVTNQDFGELQDFFGSDVVQTTGNESGFIYPPMITFRIGDLYVDQPAVLQSVNVTVSEDATWESVRGEEYSYVYGTADNKVVNKDVATRQLPNMVDISVSLRIMEKEQSLTSKYHFGPMKGWGTLVNAD